MEEIYYHTGDASGIHFGLWFPDTELWLVRPQGTTGSCVWKVTFTKSHSVPGEGRIVVRRAGNGTELHQRKKVKEEHKLWMRKCMLCWMYIHVNSKKHSKTILKPR